MNKLLTPILILVSFSLPGQVQLTWQEILETQYKVITEGNNEGLYTPTFSDDLKKLEGEVVLIAGYLVPMDISNDTYALSMSPFSSCFFCGNAGPNTVIELQFEEKQSKFMVDQFVMIKGVLRLNRFNPKRLFFTLENAQMHG